jgi:predicted RNA methylase
VETLSNDAIKAIGSMQVNNNAAKISYKVARGLYVEIDKALQATGGVWSRKHQAHVWPDGIDVANALDSIVFTGGYTDAKKDFGFFETPAGLADQIVRLAEITPGMTVLEPSAGRGRLAMPAALSGGLVTCVEIQADNAAFLRANSALPGALRLHHPAARDFVEIVCGDFLAEVIQINRFDRVIMNAPFAHQADLDHVRHAFDFLKPGGRLVAIMSNGVAFRQNKKTKDFRDWMSESPEIESGKMVQNADDAFEESGTSVRTVTLILDRVKS